MGAQKIVCITGMERSGTSMVARIANLMGISLGPEGKLIMETDYNEKGCWEVRSLLEISDEILVRFGGSSHDVPALAAGWENDERLDDLYNRAKKIIEKDFSSLPAWGWKDPRSSITLPFWQKILPDMEYVICIRNPVDVVNSLIKSGWCTSFTGAFYIWLAYTVSAVRNTKGGNRVFVFYDDFMGDGFSQEIRRLADFLGPEYAARLASVEKEISSFVSPDLRHHGTAAMDVLENQEFPFIAKAYYTILLLLAKEEGGADNRSKGIIDAISAGALSARDPEAEIMRLKNAFDVKSLQVDALLNSHSWRITAPLRAVYDMIFGKTP